MKPLTSFGLKDRIKIVFFDFDGIFTDNSVLIAEDGNEYVTCSRYDGFGLSAIIKNGLLPIVITTETKPLAQQRCAKLKISCYDSIDDKLAFATSLLNKLSLGFDNTVFMGNDINDLPLLENVAFPIVTPDSLRSVL